jgi:hypothetical protein
MRHIFFGFSTFAAISYLAYVVAVRESSPQAYNRTERAPMPVVSRAFEYTHTGDLGERHIVYEKTVKKSENPNAARGSGRDKNIQPASSSKDGFDTSASSHALDLGDNQAEKLAALGIKPREGHLSPKGGKGVGFAKRLSKGRIVAKRWDRKVSGPNAHPAIFVGKRDGQCAAADTKGCERRAVRDATFTGVVVETERLADEPSHPLEGEVKAGHYVEATPAVYVK